MIDKKKLLYFVGGFLAGCVSGYLIARGDKMLEKKKDVLKYEGVDEKYRRQSSKSKVERRQNAPVRPVEASSRRSTPPTEESIDQAKKARINNSRAWNVDDVLAESEAPIEAARAEMESDIEWADSVTRREKEYRGRKPRIISAETLGDLDSTWDAKILYYYAYDGVLATDEGELIENIGLTVGDCLEKYGFADDDNQRNIIVQNFDFNTAYEIEKVFGEFL